MTLQVIATDLRTGRVLADLPSCDFDYPLRRTIGQYEAGTAHLNLSGAPENWERAILEGGSVLHLYDDEDPGRTPQWSGLVTLQVRNGGTDIVDLSVVTAEAYFDRRYVGDLTYTGEPQNLLVADLIDRYITDGANPGLPITTTTVTAGDGTPRDRTYKDTDNATVYARLQQLMSIQGGPEWTVEWAWSVDGQSINPVLLVGDRIGAAAAAGLAPATMWSMPGCVTEVQQARDYSSGKGANKVTAYSSGQGDSTPTSGPRSATDFQGRPTYEFRWSPSSSITNTATLVQWAQQALALLSPGAIALSLTAALAAAPMYGQEWRLGDDVGYSVGGVDDQGQQTVLAFPGGITGVGRVIAYELTETTVTPILAQSEIYTEAS